MTGFCLEFLTFTCCYERVEKIFLNNFLHYNIMKYDFEDLIEWRIEELFDTKNYKISEDKTKILVFYNAKLRDDALKIYENIKEHVNVSEEKKAETPNYELHMQYLINRFANDVVDMLAGVEKKNRFSNNKIGRILREAHNWHNKEKDVEIIVSCCNLKIAVHYNGKHIRFGINTNKE